MLQWGARPALAGGAGGSGVVQCDVRSRFRAVRGTVFARCTAAGWATARQTAGLNRPCVHDSNMHLCARHQVAAKQGLRTSSVRSECTHHAVNTQLLRSAQAHRMLFSRPGPQRLNCYIEHSQRHHAPNLRNINLVPDERSGVDSCSDATCCCLPQLLSEHWHPLKPVGGSRVRKYPLKSSMTKWTQPTHKSLHTHTHTYTLTLGLGPG